MTYDGHGRCAGGPRRKRDKTHHGHSNSRSTSPFETVVTKLILAFANSVTAHGVKRAEDIFTDLMSSHVWFLSRRPKALKPQSMLLFYQSGLGLRGYARATHLGDASPADRARLAQYGLGHLSIRIDLEDVVIFNTPLNLRPLVNQLGFITNKTYWGHNLRVPARISDDDFALLIRLATTSKDATAGGETGSTVSTKRTR